MLRYERIIKNVTAKGRRRQGKQERGPRAAAAGFEFNGFPVLDLTPAMPTTPADFASLFDSLGDMLAARSDDAEHPDSQTGTAGV
jgi:hypothetical protein